MKLFPQEAGPEGCASGECLPDQPPAATTTSPAPVATRPEPPPPTTPPPDFDEPEPEPEEVHAPPPPRPAAAAARPATSGSDEDKWRRAVEAVRTASPRHGKSLSYARFLGFIPEGVRIAFPPDAHFHRMQVTGMNRPMIEAEFLKVLGRPVKLIEDTNAAALEAAPKSIAEVEQNDRSNRERQIEEKLKLHPALRNIVRHLGGSLEHITYLEPAARPPSLGPSDEGDGGPPVD